MKYSFAFLTYLAVFLLFIILGGFFVFDWVRFFNTPIVPANTTVDYILPSGGSVRILANDLNQLGLLKRPLYFETAAYLKGYAKNLRAGEYRFDATETPLDILKQISQGRVLWREMIFIEGETFYEISQKLNQNKLLVHLPLTLPVQNPEGLFFPDTYKYTAGMSDKTILLQAYEIMQEKLNQEWSARDKSVPYKNPYEALIAASIIEKEAKINSERFEISGVIKRRLEKNMLLQMDPTVIYALGPDFKPPLKKADLKVESLYNTYTHLGLPPTPICLPSLASIHAALHPAGGDVLYFVAKGDGTHKFSASYSAHKAAIAHYEKKSAKT